MKYALTFAVVLGSYVAAAAAADEPAPVFKVGATTVDITPPPGMPMWGYGARKDLHATEARDPLRASVVVIDIGPEKLALVGLDLGRSPARATTDKIKARVREEAGVGTIYLVGSHTHHGPCLELETVGKTAEYIRALTEKLVKAVTTAAHGVKPAKLAIAKIELEMNRNRHTKKKPKPVDRELAVLRFDDADGKRIATVVNFAAHPTTRRAQMLEWSADYPGPLKTRVEKEVGGVCVFLQGACGDLSASTRGKTTDEFGAALGDRAVELSRSAKPVRPPHPSIRSTNKEFTFSSRIDISEPLTYLKYCIAFFPNLVNAYVAEYKEGVRPNVTVTILNGELALVGGSGEFFCTHALRLKKESRAKHTLFLGYCNGYHQYFPTLEAIAEGGYGADPAVAPAEPGAGETMVKWALAQIEKLTE